MVQEKGHIDESDAPVSPRYSSKNSQKDLTQLDFNKNIIYQHNLNQSNENYHSRKKLLVFDPSGIIFYKVHRRDFHISKQIAAKYKNGSFRKNNYRIYLRPGAIEFLHYLIHEYQGDIMIWTSMEEQTAYPIIRKLVGPYNMCAFKAIWYRPECDIDTEGEEYDVIKSIDKIIANPVINSDGQLDKSSIIIYDDNFRKIRCVDNNSRRLVPTFDATKWNNDDKFLFELIDELRNDKFCTDCNF